MSGYARIVISESQIWVRFERIGRGSRFNLLLDTFRSKFPWARWDENHKAWQLPVRQIDQIVNFCNDILGPGKIEFRTYDTMMSSIRQLSFPLGEH